MSTYSCHNKGSNDLQSLRGINDNVNVFKITLDHARVESRKRESLGRCLPNGGVEEPGGTRNDALDDNAARPKYLNIDTPTNNVNLTRMSISKQLKF